MRKLGLSGSQKRKFIPQTTDSKHNFPISPNLLQQNFRTAKANQAWVSDITYIKLDRGSLYLCTIIDLFSRKVVGYFRKSYENKYAYKGIAKCYRQLKTQGWVDIPFR